MNQTLKSFLQDKIFIFFSLKFYVLPASIFFLNSLQRERVKWSKKIKIITVVVACEKHIKEKTILFNS